MATDGNSTPQEESKWRDPEGEIRGLISQKTRNT